jgi:hypothetical protein
VYTQFLDMFIDKWRFRREKTQKVRPAECYCTHKSQSQMAVCLCSVLYIYRLYRFDIGLYVKYIPACDAPVLYVHVYSSLWCTFSVCTCIFQLVMHLFCMFIYIPACDAPVLYVHVYSSLWCTCSVCTCIFQLVMHLFYMFMYIPACDAPVLYVHGLQASCST